MTPTAIVSKLCNCCNVLRDDGMSCGDYVEQLTYLLFLKMADEGARTPRTVPASGAHRQPSAVPDGFDWPMMSADVKGDAYEGLLEAAPFHPLHRGDRTSLFIKNAQKTKSGQN
jgi:type I restriction enzyme M protein